MVGLSRVFCALFTTILHALVALYYICFPIAIIVINIVRVSVSLASVIIIATIAIRVV